MVWKKFHGSIELATATATAQTALKQEAESDHKTVKNCCKLHPLPHQFISYTQIDWQHSFLVGVGKGKGKGKDKKKVCTIFS
jgi:hypothetical protein